MQRYQRQMNLIEIGESGQRKLLGSRVLVVGAGGLGCPVLSYLTGAGVGTLGIVDGDNVELSNLHRQVLFGENHIGQNKSTAVCKALRSLNNDVNPIPFPFFLNPSNAFDIASGFDLVVDATDRFSTRYLLDDTCRLLQIPLVYASINGFEIQVAVFHHKNASHVSVSYRDLFPEPVSSEHVFSCTTNGVLGVVPGLAGVVQATETLKILLDFPDTLSGKLLVLDTMKYASYTLDIPRKDHALDCAPAGPEELASFDYIGFCNEKVDLSIEIEPEKALLLLSRKDAVLIDIRLADEFPKLIHSISVPFSEAGIMNSSCFSDLSEIILIICQSGKRSLRAAKEISLKYPEKKIYSIHGGVHGLIEKELIQSFELEK